MKLNPKVMWSISYILLNLITFDFQGDHQHAS